MKHQPDDVEHAEELVRRVLPAFDVEVSPDFRAQVLARAEALSASRRRRGLRWEMPTWVQGLTPALAMVALLISTFTFLVNGPLDRGKRSLSIRGSSSRQEVGKTLDELIQEGDREKEAHPSQAAQAYRRAVDRFAYPLNALAWLASEEGTKEAAAKGLAWAQFAVQLQPDEMAYRDTLAVLLCRLDRRDEAIRTLESALQLHPDNQDIKDRLASFRQGTCQ